MLVLKYLLMILGVGIFGSATALVIYDIYLSAQLLRLLRREKLQGTGAGVEATLLEPRPSRPVRWRLASQLVLLAIVPALFAVSIVVIPDGSAGVRVSQIWGNPSRYVVSGRPHHRATDRRAWSCMTRASRSTPPRPRTPEVEQRGADRAGAGGPKHRPRGDRALPARPPATDLHSRQPAAAGRRRSCGPHGSNHLPPTRAELRHARNFRDQARRAADLERPLPSPPGSAPMELSITRSAPPRFETARRVREGPGRTCS